MISIKKKKPNLSNPFGKYMVKGFEYEAFEKERKNKIIGVSVVIHLVLFLLILLFAPEYEKEKIFEIEFEPLKNNIPKEIEHQIEREIRKVEKQKKDTTAKHQSHQQTTSESSKRSGLTDENNFENQFEEKFLHTNQKSNTNLSHSSRRSSGFTDNTEGFRNDGYNKSHGDENVNVPGADVSKGDIRWNGTYDRKLLNRVKPEYPAYLQRQSVQGNVKLSLEVDSSGRVIQVSVLESSGYSKLDISAKNAAYKLRFSPSQSVGKTDRAEIEYKFYLPN